MAGCVEERTNILAVFDGLVLLQELALWVALSVAKDMLRQHEYHEELLSYRNLSVTNCPFAVVASGNAILEVSI